MDDETQKIITEQMKILPKDVVSAIVSVDYKTKLQEITKRQKLLIDQAGKLEMETTLVMIGLEPLADYVGNLQRELGLPIIKAKEIALDVSENIFKPIRESLRTMNEQAESGEEAIKSEINLDRNQVLNEIENPIPNRQPATLTSASPSLLENKMMDITITPRQIVNAKPEIKLPELKKRPYGGVDPYKEPLS